MIERLTVATSGSTSTVFNEWGEEEDLNNLPESIRYVLDRQEYALVKWTGREYQLAHLLVR